MRAKATVRGVYQQALAELEAAARWQVAALDVRTAPPQVRDDPAPPLQVAGTSG